MSEHTDWRTMYGTIEPEPPPPPLWKMWLSALWYWGKFVAGFALGAALIAIVGGLLHWPPVLIWVSGVMFGYWYTLR